MKRPPSLGRLLSLLLTGDDGEILRGDLEESYRRRNAIAARSYLADVMKSLLKWWSPSAVLRRRRKSPSTGGNMGFGIFEDLGYVCRNLIRRPGFAITVLVTLGLGIGATTTIYSVVDAVVVRALPYPDADRLVVLGTTTPGNEWRDDGSGLQRLARMSVPNAFDWKERSHSLDKMVVVEANPIVQMRDGGAEIVQRAAVGDGFFEMFPAKPIVGRFFTKDDFVAGTGQMLSYGAWVRRYGADPKAPVIGVLPPDFQQPEALGKQEIEFWTPLDPQNRRYTPRNRPSVAVFGRLRPGVTVEAARSELAAIQTEVANEFPNGNLTRDGKPLGAGVNYLHSEIVGASGRTLSIFLAASGLLLLIAALNAANLLLVRGLDREREVSVRQALGASPTRLVRAQLSESLVLALLAGGIGVALAYAGVEAFVRLGPATLPRISAVAVNWRILAATITLSLGIGIAVGLLPALRLTGRDIAAAMRRSVVMNFTHSGGRLRQLMVVAQLAVAVLLCIGACLLINSYARLRARDPGFEASRLTVFSVSLKRPNANVNALWLDWDELRRNIESIAGLESVAIASNLPFQSRAWEPSILLPEDSTEVFRTGISGFSVTPDFFDAMGINMKSGRSFSVQDGPSAPQVAIVNEAFLRQYMSGRDPLGSIVRLRNFDESLTPLQIVGVVDDVVQARVEDGWLPAIYLPYAQPGSIARSGGNANVAVRSNRPPEELITELRRAVAAFTPIPILDSAVMEERIGQLQTGPRFNALLIGTFAAVAILLAAVGLYGTMAHSVGRRTGNSESEWRLARTPARSSRWSYAKASAFRPLDLLSASAPHSDSRGFCEVFFSKWMPSTP